MSPQEQRETIERIRVALEGKRPLEILLVEDQAFDAELTQARLQQLGLTVYWATNTITAEELLSTHDPCMAFLDLKLENTSGLNVLHLIKTMRPECKVVILTGQYNHDSAECKDALSSGALAVMLKPLTDEQIQLIFGTPYS